MKKLILTAALLTAGFSVPAQATDVGVSVSIGQPGFYGRIDIGGYPPPPVVYSRPVLIAPVPVQGPPVYLRVPPGHARHWSKHCSEYGACGERVYFVRDEWYTREYAPRYRDEHRHHGDRDEGHGRDHRHGHGHGHGHGRGHD